MEHGIHVQYSRGHGWFLCECRFPCTFPRRRRFLSFPSYFGPDFVPSHPSARANCPLNTTDYATGVIPFPLSTRELSQFFAVKSNFNHFRRKEIFECLNYFETQPGPVAKNATLGHPAGNRTRDPANLVRYSANWTFVTGLISSRMA